MSVKTVSHQIELTIRRNERNVALLLELVQSNALVELDVLHLNKFASCSPILHLEEDFVIETKLELRHTAQITPHMDTPKDFRP